MTRRPGFENSQSRKNSAYLNREAENLQPHVSIGTAYKLVTVTLKYTNRQFVLPNKGSFESDVPSNVKHPAANSEVL